MSAGLADHPVLAPGILNGFHLLEADAGTGKTWTISGLVVRALVERDLDIGSVLVVTFTRAATAELSERVRARLEQVVAAIEHRLGVRAHSGDDPFCQLYASRIPEPKAALRKLKVALARIDEAQVRTIHAFCHRVIVEHAMSIGLAQGLRADALGNEWIERGLAAWWRESIAGAPLRTLALLHACGVSPASLLAPVRAIDARPGARVVPACADWRGLAGAIETCRQRLRSALVADGDRLLAWAGVKGNANGTAMRPAYVASRLAALADFVQTDLDAGGDIPPEVAKLTSAYIAQDGKYAVPGFGLIGVCDELEELRLRALGLAGVIAHEAAIALARRRLELKIEQGAIDHDDLLRIVRDALARPASGERLAASLRLRYPVALIDECQDTDAMQWEIFRAIYPPAPARAAPSGLCAGRTSGEGHALVLVGDPKQSIYAFRAADVYAYLEARAAGPTLHALRDNQRSVPSLLDALNALFARANPFLVPEIAFGPARVGDRPHPAFRDRAQSERGAITVFELDARHAGLAHDAMIPKDEGSRQAVAASVAEISRLLSEGEVMLDERALTPGDIAVLVNSHHEGAIVKRALQQAGIGAAEISRDSVLESRECAELIRVIAAIATPSDVGLVRGALATMLLDRLAIAYDDAAAPGLLAQLAAARSRWSAGGAQAALRELFGALDAYRGLAGVRDGERRLTNLAHLTELLDRSPEAREGAAPALRWLMRTRSDPESLGADAVELRLESDENLVRIVTVHKSKGLEYPIVFVPFAWSGREFARRRGKPRSGVSPAATPIHYHELPDHPVPGPPTGARERQEGGVDADPARWRAVLDFEAVKDTPQWRQAGTEAYSEALRVLYVATTRARQRCYLCWGAVASAQFAPLSWLLAGLDPRAQRDSRSGSKTPAALTAAIASDALQAWARGANRRAPDAARVLEVSGLLGGPGAGRAHAGQARPTSSGEPGDSSRRSGWRETQGTPDRLAAREFVARIPRPWVQTSFTALARLIDEHDVDRGAVARIAAERPDHDQSVVPQADPSGSDAVRFAFPAGPLAGTCLHGILEQVAFSRPVEVALVSGALARVGYRQVDPRAVARWLDEVIATPLGGDDGRRVLLAELDESSIVREMEFHLAARDVDTREVIEAVASEFRLDARIATHRWSGFLRGFIDLVYSAAGRWYLLDWKSNRLGSASVDYEHASMERANAANAYPLQFCLYALALHRLLRVRVHDYAYHRDFGGVRYVYLRGVQSVPGGNDDRDGDDGAPTRGVYASRPSEALIERLDRLFGAGR